MSPSVRARPPLLRALGVSEPPEQIEVAGQPCQRIEIFKHDSWAATARYQGEGLDLVCKFNRVHPIVGMPTRWLGKRLADRESGALRQLADVSGVPAELGPIHADGKRIGNAVAHTFIVGRPFHANDRPDDAFFPVLRDILAAVHDSGMAYVDLHKRENIIVAADGSPHLIDFQVCFGLWTKWSRANPAARSILRSLQAADWYHLGKHIARHRPDQLDLLEGKTSRPWLIRAHRRVAVPLRSLRRKLLTTLGVRAKDGMATSEAFPEDAIRRELRRAA